MTLCQCGSSPFSRRFCSPASLGHQRLEASTADATMFYPDRVIERLDQQSQPISWPDGIREIMFIDPSIGDLKALLRGLPPSIETLILDPERDGVRQMTQALRHHRGVQAIHIVSHGGPGRSHSVERLACQSSGRRARRFAAALDAALAEDGDILIYGCNFGAGETGRLAVQTLARATGADVAASEDVTGNATLGGDWHLEVAEGDVTVQPLAALREGFTGVLQNDYSEYTPINIQVGVYTNTLTFQWELPTPTAGPCTTTISAWSTEQPERELPLSMAAEHSVQSKYVHRERGLHRRPGTGHHLRGPNKVAEHPGRSQS